MKPFLDAVEITLDSPGAVAPILQLARRFEGRVRVGAGTVRDVGAHAVGLGSALTKAAPERIGSTVREAVGHG